MPSTSYAAKALRKALMESGAKKVAHVVIAQVGPTLNLLKTNRSIGKEFRARQSQYAALLQSLPSEPSDPGTTTDWEPPQSTIWMDFDTSECLKMIPQNTSKSLQLQNVSGIFGKKKRSSNSSK